MHTIKDILRCSHVITINTIGECIAVSMKSKKLAYVFRKQNKLFFSFTSYHPNIPSSLTNFKNRISKNKHTLINLQLSISTSNPYKNKQKLLNITSYKNFCSTIIEFDCNLCSNFRLS